MKTTKLYQIKRLLGKEVKPPTGKVKFGDMARSRPFCQSYGLSRGTAIDRVFIEAFLGKNQEKIRGEVLEIRNNDYTVRFGGDRVRQSWVLDIDPNNKDAGIIDDLRTLKTVEDESFDCIIFTQTLHVIDDDIAVLRNLFRVLRPGGTLLMTVPCISWVPRREDQGKWHRFYTDHGLDYLLREYFQPAKFVINTYGNLFAAAGFLYGLAAEDVGVERLGSVDPAYPLIIGAVVQKAE